MSKFPKLEKMRFLPLLGLILAVDIVLTFLYTILVPGLSMTHWADTLCISAFVLAIGGAVPVFLDAGRGFAISAKMGGSKTAQQQALKHERSLREKGMKYTFLLALATFIIGLLSMILSVI